MLEEGGGEEAGPSKGGSISRIKLSSVGLDDNGNEVEEWDYLNRFFRRFNKCVFASH